MVDRPRALLEDDGVMAQPAAAASFSASRCDVASRYSLTQRSITAPVFSTFSNWPTTCPTGLNATSTVWSGHLCVAATATPETMYCSGMPNGSGVSGSAQASVHSFFSMRHGLPVNERERTVSRELAPM